jgi:3-deoxy-D-manno-octulosonic-acid transferase
MLRFIYTFLFYLATPFLLIRLYWKGLKNPGYRLRWRERFGLVHVDPCYQGGIWIHAVSLGESIAATPLINQLMRELSLPLTITTTTPTGSEKIQALYGNKIFHSYLPYDLPCALRCFITKVKPKLLVVMETELWPNLYAHCKKHDIPIVIANARLSPHSFKAYLKFPHAMKDLLSATTLIAAQTQIDKTRFEQLGAAPHQIKILGSIKFDIHIPASSFEKGASIRQQWGAARTILIAASTHEGEEEIVLDAFDELKAAHPALLLVLVPRHPERFAKVIQMCLKRNYQIIKRSEHQACTAKTDIFIGDSIGELVDFYAGSDIALIAGSFFPIGGHNMLEAAACGLPVLTGPHVFNSLAFYELLTKAGVLFTVSNKKEIVEVILSLVNNPNEREKIAEKAREVVAQNRGACAKHFENIQAILQKK